MLKNDWPICVGVVIQKRYPAYNPYFSHLVNLTMMEFKRQNIPVQLIFMEQTIDNEYFQKSSLNGLLLIDQFSEKQLECIRKTGIPFVWLDPPSFEEPCDHIHADNFISSYRMAELVASKGHKRILLLGNKKAHISFYDRYRGLQTYITEHPNLCLQLMELDYYPAKVGFDEDQLQMVLQRPDRPTAIFAMNDDTARMAIEVLRKWNIVIPDDISIVGFDNMREVTEFDAILTTVNISKIELAVQAVSALLNRIRNPQEDLHLITVKTDIVMRKSLGQRPFSA